MVYSPPGSAVYYKLHDGWTPDTHKITDLIEVAKMLVCSNHPDPQAAYAKVKPERRPGDPLAAAAAPMTIGEYMEKAGLEEV